MGKILKQKHIPVHAKTLGLQTAGGGSALPVTLKCNVQAVAVRAFKKHPTTHFSHHRFNIRLYIFLFRSEAAIVNEAERPAINTNMRPI
jgi:hypothetical protein